MKRIIPFLVFIITLNTTCAQFTISGELKPTEEFKTMLLYKTEGAFQLYKSSAVIGEDGLFVFTLSKDYEVGSYRLVYDVQNNLYVNILFNNEDISFVFDPYDVINSIYFYDSKENTLFFDYIRSINEKYIQLDSVQKELYINKSKKLSTLYNKKHEEIKTYQKHFETEAKGRIVLNFIKAYKKEISQEPLKSKSDYYSFLRKTFLNSIDFQNETLRNSSFIIDRLNEYVFDLNDALARKNNTQLDTLMVDKALENIEESKFKNEVIYSLTSSSFDPYSSQYDVLFDHLYNKYYLKLPENFKVESFTEMADAKIKVIVGKKAPQIIFNDEFTKHQKATKISDLHSIKSDSILLIFWSTTCSHCLKEIPEVYEHLSTNKNITVVMVGVEESYSDWESVVGVFPKWLQYRANGKWKNEYAIAYNIKMTPSYFLLNKEKNIITKPDNLISLMKLFGVEMTKENHDHIH